MRLPARLSLTAVAALSVVSAIWATAPRNGDRFPVLVPLAVHQPYDCPAHQGLVEVDLPTLPPGERYRLIISSLAELPSTWDLRLSCRAMAAEDQPSAAVRAVPALSPFPVSKRSEFHGVSSFSDSGTPMPSDIAPRRRFAIHVTDGSLEDPAHYTTIAANLQASNHRIHVYLDEQCLPTADRFRRCQELTETAGRLLSQLEESLGPLRDVDKNGGLTLVLTPWLGRLQSGRTSLGGFVRSGDFRRLPPPFSNQGDIVYLNADLPQDEALRTLLAHEMTHVLAIGCRIAASGDRPAWTDEEDWLSEGLAHLMEIQFAGEKNIDHRIARYRDDPARYPLVVDDYYRSGFWRNHGCRGATWSFLSWCRTRFGSEFPRRLANSRFRGTANLKYATGISFQELFREWTLACLRENDPEWPNSTRSPRQILGRFEVNPPLCRVVQSSGETHEFALASSSASFWELQPLDEARGRLRVESPPNAQLQVTVVRVPAKSTQLMVQARWKCETSGRADEIEIRARDGMNPVFQIETVTLQRFTLTAAETLRFDSSKLQLENDRSIHLTLAAAVTTRVPLDRSAQAESAGPWTLRIVARRPDGSRVLGGVVLPVNEATAITTYGCRQPQSVALDFPLLLPP